MNLMINDFDKIEKSNEKTLLMYLKPNICEPIIWK
jgi:hypothetical protein